MRQALELVSVTQSSPGKATRPSRRSRIIGLCGLVWTVFVALALWWLLRGDSGPSVYIIHDGNSAPRATVQKFRAWSKGDLGIERVYPWVLLGPYMALVALYFPLERGRLRLSLALNLAACAGFVAASHAIGERISVRGETVVFLRTGGVLDGGSGGTNVMEVAVTQSAGSGGIGGLAGGGGIIQDTREIVASGGRVTGDSRELVPAEIEKLRGVSAPGISNLLAQLQLGRKGARPILPPAGLPRPGLLSMLLDLLAYCAVVGLAHSVHFYRRLREREHQALFLESNLAQARLNTLRAQLQPHFLFNSLNAIAALLRRDPRLAEATLLSLSELLRLALSQSERQEVSLREEINFVGHYLEIQQTRFGDRLRIEQEIEPAALECLVPTLLLQPVVENAIRHGIEPGDKAGLVRVTANQEDGRLVLTVADNGVGLSRTALELASTSVLSGKTSIVPLPNKGSLGVVGEHAGNGIGLTNLRARLETLYGTEQKLELAERKEGGVTVRIELPWRPAAPSESAGGIRGS
jgi:two-component sensor histidine kinase